MSDADPLKWSLLEASCALERGYISSQELTACCLDRSSHADPLINCFIDIREKEAKAAARKADERRSNGERGKLLGIPLAHKDMFARLGYPCSCGARHVRPPSATDATVISRLSDAGAIDLGALHMTEYALGHTGHSEVLLPARNPWNIGHITGGSSSGPAAAVAAGCVFGALGSDTGGSIRLPAHFCGLSGLKPTHGVVPRTGAMPLSSTFDTIGPIAHDVADLAVLFSAIVGPDNGDPITHYVGVPDEREFEIEPKNLVVGLPSVKCLIDVESAISNAFENAVHTLSEFGIKFRTIRLPDLDDSYETILSCEALAAHASLINTASELYGKQTLLRLKKFHEYSVNEYIKSQRDRDSFVTHYLDAMQSVDAILLPTCCVSAPLIIDTDLQERPEAQSLVRSLTRFTRPANLAGLPALSVRAGFSDQGLPIGLQFLGRPKGDWKLLALGRAFQTATSFHHQRPSLPII